MTPAGDPAPDPPEGADSDPVAVLTRWERSGAVWRVLARSRAGVTVGLLSCDGGEEMGRLTSSDPALLALVDDRPDSEHEPPTDPDL